MLIDTHCHLEKKEYEILDNLIDNILNSDVKIIVVSGYDVASSLEAIELAHRFHNIYATVGFHPHDCKDIKDDDYKLFNNWLIDDKVVGVGEIGLDYYYDVNDKDKQIEMFKKQIEIASRYNKPIVIHNRNASDDIYNILKCYKARGIIHCFNDDISMANKFISLGFLLGIGGIITFKKNTLKSVIGNIDIKAFVLETDSPYLTPEPFRGTKNSPLNLPLIAKCIADIKGYSYEEVGNITSKNASSLFDFNTHI
jgi:TatD DNase family protein